MTIKRLIHVMVAAGLIGAYGTANAVSITAVASSTDVGLNDQITVDIFANFADDPTVGGTYDVLYNTADLAVASYNAPAVGDPGFFVPAVELPGNIQGAGFGDFGGLGDIGLVATIVFEVIGVFDSTSIALQDGTGGGGPFFSAVTFGQQTVNYQGVTLNQAPIPLPAAVWLMMGGLGAMFGFGRKKA